MKLKLNEIMYFWNLLRVLVFF